MFSAPQAEKVFASSEVAPVDEIEASARVIANEKRAAARARKALRLFVVANVLTRMWTLTYRDAHWDRAGVVADVNDWLQRLRKELGEAFPAAYVLELHPEGHGFHVHVAVQSRYVRWELMAGLWGHGHVQYSDGNKAVRRVKGKRARSRMLARYLCKYMAKGWAEQHQPGDHRYEVTEGFQPELRRRVFRTYGEAIGWLREMNGGVMAQEVVCSKDWEDWFGPPVWVMVWR